MEVEEAAAAGDDDDAVLPNEERDASTRTAALAELTNAVDAIGEETLPL